MEDLMKIYTKNPTCFTGRCALFLGTILTIALMVPVASVSQSFVEYAGNPLFGGATSGVDRAYQPYVIKIDGMYHMWYGDGVNARYTSSTYPDGWTLGENYYPQKLVAYYTDGVNSWTANPKIAVSDNGINWTFVTQTTGVQEYPSPTALYRLSVLYEGNNTWKGYGDQGQAIIQYYTSTNGIDWTGIATDILKKNDPQFWESSSGAISPFVFKVNSTYVMTYSAGLTNNNQAIGIASSKNGLNFMKASANPIFNRDDGIAWRTDRTYNSYIMYDDGLWRMYFQGGSAAGIYAVGMATSEILSLTGQATKVLVETGADGSGTVVPLQSVASGNSITVYAISRDANDNFVGNVAAYNWVLTNVTGGVVSGDLVQSGDNKSAVFTGHVAGTAAIQATSGALATTKSGTITVIDEIQNSDVFNVTVVDPPEFVNTAAGVSVDVADAVGTGTVGSSNYIGTPSTSLSFFVGTEKTAAKYVDVYITGLTNGTAKITVSYTDGEVAALYENTLNLYMFYEGAWHLGETRGEIRMATRYGVRSMSQILPVHRVV